MINKVFTVYDSKAEVYMSPFLFQNKGEAIRAFTESLKDTSNPNNMMAKYPQDFTLFQVAEYDNETAKFTECKVVSLGNGVEFLPAVDKLDKGK